MEEEKVEETEVVEETASEGDAATAAQEAAAEAPAAGAAEDVASAVEAAAESAAESDPELQAKLKETQGKLKEAMSALKSRNEADSEGLAEEEKSLIEDLSEGDPVRWAAIYAKMKKAGKVGGSAKASEPEMPEADRTRVSADAGSEAPPSTPEESRAAFAKELNRI